MELDQRLLTLVLLACVFAAIPLVSERLSTDFSRERRSLYIRELDLAVPKGEKACVKLGGQASENASVIINGAYAKVLSGEFCLNLTKNVSLVIKSNELKNKVKVKAVNLSCEPTSTKLKLSLPSRALANSRVNVNVTIYNGDCRFAIKELWLKVGEKRIVKRVLLGPKEEKTITLSFAVEQSGEHKIEARVSNSTASALLKVLPSPYAFFSFITLVFCVLLFLVKSNDITNVLNFFFIFLSYFTLFPLLLDLMGFKNVLIPTISLFPLFVILLAIHERVARNERARAKSKRKGDKKLVAVCLFLTLAFIELPKFLFPSQDTLWNAFYERIAAETYYSEKIPRYDERSYFGRPMSYPPGYFVLKAAILRAFDLPFNLASTLLLELGFNLAFLLSIFCFLQRIGYESEEAALIASLFSSTIFVYTLLAAHLLHVPSLALLFTSLFYFAGGELIKCFVALLASTLIHPFSSLLFFAIAALTHFNVIGKAKETKRRFKKLKLAPKQRLLISLAFSILSACLYFLLNYPRITLAGKLKVVSPREWGWLIAGELFGLPVELGLLFPISLFVTFVFLLEKKPAKSLVFLLLLLAYSFVSFRVNLLLSFLVACLLIEISKKTSKPILLFLCSLNFLLSLLLLPQNLGGYVASWLIDGSRYLASLEGTRVIAPPLYCHYLEYRAGKSCLADLYVEYASQEKYNDAVLFADTCNEQIARKWKAELGMTFVDCEEFPILYDNGIIRIALLTPANLN